MDCANTGVCVPPKQRRGSPLVQVRFELGAAYRLSALGRVPVEAREEPGWINDAALQRQAQSNVYPRPN